MKKLIQKPLFHMASTWARENTRSVRSGFKVDDKSNEITAIPKLFITLDISRCIATISGQMRAR